MRIKYLKYDEWKGKAVASEVIEAMLNSYSYSGVWSFKNSVTNKWEELKTGGCYGSMPITGVGDAKAIRILLWSIVDHHNAAEWWHQNILGPESPWKSLFDELGGEVTIYKNVDGKTHIGGHLCGYGVLEFNINAYTSFRNLMSMMIAIRQTKVEPGTITMAHKIHYAKLKEFNDLKFSETLAILCLTSKIDGRRSSKAQAFNTGNGWLGVSQHISPQHIAQGVFAHSDLPVRGARYYPSDATWDDKDSHDKYIDFISNGTNVVTVEPFFKFNVNGTPLIRNTRLYSVEFADMLKFVRSPIRKDERSGA